MPEYKVISHTHDGEEGVYRLVIGQEVTYEQPMVDDEQNVILDDDDNPLVETVTELIPVEDFLFADHDDRWTDKTDDQIVDSQIRSIKRVYKQREEATQRQADRQGKLRELPGVGRKV